MQIKHLALFSTIAMILMVSFVPFVQAAPGDCSAPSFNTAPNFGTEKNPNAVAVGDFNRDGKADLAVANYGSNTFSILNGDGEGAFSPPRSFPVGIVNPHSGSGPRDLEVSDFNGDGKLDLVVVGGNASGWASVLLGDGEGGFGSPLNLTTGVMAYAVSVGDFNGDGKRDFAVAAGNSRRVSFLLGDGNGGFSLAGNVTVSSDPNAITVGDFNGDNIDDVAVTGSYFDWKVSIILGSNNGTFVVNNSFSIHWSPSSIAAADFNGDGKTDLAVTISWSTPEHNVAIMLGDGTGNFGPAKEIFIGYEPLSVVARDFNKDGKPDLAIAVSGSNSVAILTGNGAGGFSAPKYFGTSVSPSALAVGDFNKDGELDLVSTHSNADLVSVLTGDDTGGFATARTEISWGAKVASADFNGDGRPDLAMPANSVWVSPPIVEVRLNNGAGGLSSPAYYQVSRTPQSILINDLNHDGKVDLIVGHVAGLSVLFGNGTGQFSPATSIAAPTGYGVITGGDFNGDNNFDLAMLSNNTNANLAIMLGNGTGGFGPPSNIASATDPVSLATGDFNGDGKLDLVMSNGYGTVTIMLGDGGGGFTQAPYSPVTVSRTNAYDTIYITTGDLNKDGLIDLITANTEVNSLSVLLNSGSGFQSALTVSPGTSPKAVMVGDFNDDGNPDLVAVVNNKLGNISVLTGDGLGNFAPPVFFVAGGSSADLVVRDFNGDGKPDLAVAGTPITSANITLLLNTFKIQPCLSVEDVQVAEGNAGSSSLVFTVSLSAAQSEPVKVNYFLRENTAKSGVDYQPVSGRLVFAPGVTQQAITVPIISDALDEFDEDFYLLLSNPANAAISREQATGTITDDDPEPTITIDDVSIMEGNFGSQNSALFNVTLSAPSTKQISVSYTIDEGTATRGVDFVVYTLSPITVPAGTTKVTIPVAYSGEITYEPDETFFVNLSNPVNATIARGQGKGTILNDDPIPTISIENSFGRVEGESAPNNATFNVKLSHPSYQAISVNYTTTDGTAVAGSDYVATTGTLTINPGEINKGISVQVLDDNLDEIDETFFVNLSGPINTSINTGQAQGRIYDNDGPTVSINDIAITEGNTGTVNANFTVTLSAVSPQDVFVKYVTSADTATSNVDYQRVTSSFTNLKIPAGEKSATVTILVIGDYQVEPDELFTVMLSNPISSTLR